jgi:hypothetical protein
MKKSPNLEEVLLGLGSNSYYTLMGTMGNLTSHFEKCI